MTTYTQKTCDHWPDSGLNRILATLECIGLPDLSEVECLEILFYFSSRRPDSRDLAEAAIETYGSLAKVFARSGRELRRDLGLDNMMTSHLAITKSAMKYILMPDAICRKEIPSYNALMNYLAIDLREAEQEILRVLYLDAKHKLIKDEEFARGTVNGVPIYPKEIARRALLYCASSVILAHNHLSDDPTPSQDDIGETRKTKNALDYLDITLQDHVIISRNRSFSMQKEWLI